MQRREEQERAGLVSCNQLAREVAGEVKHGVDQRLRDRSSNAVSGTGDQRGLARGIEWIVQQAHLGRGSDCGAFSQILTQNRDRVHLQSTKDQRSDSFSDVMLIETHRPIGKLYEAGEKTQNLQA